MISTTTFALIQATPELLPSLERIASAQIVTAAGSAVVALVAIGLGILAFSAMRSIGRTVSRLERQVERMAPRVEPMLDRAARMAEDAGEVSRSIRRTADDLVETAQVLNAQLRDLSESAEDRVRRIGAVLTVVQRETEAMLLDAAATARGVQVTAEALRNPPAREPEPVGPSAGSPDTAAG